MHTYIFELIQSPIAAHTLFNVQGMEKKKRKPCEEVDDVVTYLHVQGC